MATRRHKITRSAVRRVKRRESKNAKLKSLRSRKNARKYSTAKNKRLNLREMRGGLWFNKDHTDFFSIYHVTTPGTDTISRWGPNGRAIEEKINVSMDVGILFYNHKTGHFRLFSKDPRNPMVMVKLVNGLCGLGTDTMVENTYGMRGWQYYYIFDGKKLWAVNIRNGQIDITQGQSPAADVTKLENKTDQTVEFSGATFTLDKIVDDNTAETTHQGSTSFTDGGSTKRESYFQQALAVYDILSEKLQEKKKLDLEKKNEKEKSEKEAAAMYAASPEGMAKAAAAAASKTARDEVWKKHGETFERFKKRYDEDERTVDYAFQLLNAETIEADDFRDSSRMETNKLSQCFKKVLLRKNSREVSKEDLENLKKCVSELRSKFNSDYTNNGIHNTFKDVSKTLSPLLKDTTDPDKLKAIKQGILYSLDDDLDNLTPEQKLKYDKKMLIITAYSDADDLKTLVEDKDKFETEFKKWDAIYDMISRKLQFLLLEKGLSSPTYEGTTLDYKNFKKFLYDLLSDTHFIIK